MLARIPTANKVILFSWFLIAISSLLSLSLHLSTTRREARNAEEASQLSQPAPRIIYFKLPIAQTSYHWIFEDRAAFLAGKLTLHIERDDQSIFITVFENGIISEGWEEISCKSDMSPSDMYFGFVSFNQFTVANGDHVEMHLTVSKDLEGIGPQQRGLLKAGEYQSACKFTVFSTDGDTAFLRKEEWSPQWDVAITDSVGWMD